MGKYKIRKNSVQETLIIPLYGRHLCAKRFPALYQDTTATMLMEKIDYDFSSLSQQSNRLLYTFGALEVAMRQNDLAWEVRDYLTAHPKAAVVNLGCGLDNTGRTCDNGRCHIFISGFRGSAESQPGPHFISLSQGTMRGTVR